MSLHALKEYIKYRWKAKTRHGIHSPFVYDLIDKVLLNPERDKGDYKILPADLSENTKMLIAPIITYYTRTNPHFPEEPIFVFLNAEKALNEVSTKHIVIVTDIHTNKICNDKWEELCADNKVSLSIDLYHTGLLFFRKEFKEKQHFVLKY